MFLFDNKSDVKLNNKGYSLIELLVVIAIMSILVGGLSVSVSLLYSRDAYQAAKKIDDMLTETRMLAMSRSGDFFLEVTKDSDEYKAKIVNVEKVTTLDAEGNTVETTNNVEYSSLSLGKKVKIYDGNSITGVPSDTDSEITYDMGTGFRITYQSKGMADGNGPLATDGCFKIKVLAIRGGKMSTVKIVKLTGRHLVEGD